MAVPNERTDGVASRSGLRQIGRVGAAILADCDLRKLLACSVILGLGGSFVAPFLSIFGTIETGMSVTAFGAFMTMTALGNIGAGTCLSHVSDRMASRRTVLLMGPAAGVLGYTGFAFIREPWALLGVGTLVLGVASVTFSQIFAVTRERLDMARIATADVPLYMNSFRMAFAFSWTMGPALAASTLAAFGFRGLFMVTAAYHALLLGLLLTVRCEPKEREPVQSRGRVERSLFQAEPSLFGWFCAFVAVFSAQTISLSNMSLFILRELGGTERDVGIIFCIAPICEVPLMLYIGLMVARNGAVRLVRASLVLSLCYFVGLAIVRAPWQVYPLQVLSAAIVAVTGGVAITFFQNKVSPGRVGAATNLYANAQRLGSTLGYLLFGTIASAFGYRGVYVACSLLAALAVVCGLLSQRRGAVQHLNT